MTLANKLTLSRVFMIPVFLLCYYIDFPYHEIFAFVVFAVAGITDNLDGRIARKHNQVTTFGKFVDPLADKLLVCSAFLAFTEAGYMHGIAAFIIIGRELTITSLRILAINEGVVMSADISGKIKTFTQMIIILIALLLPFVCTTFFPSVPYMLLMNILSWITAAVTLWSGIDYIYRYRALIIKSI